MRPAWVSSVAKTSSPPSDTALEARLRAEMDSKIQQLREELAGDSEPATTGRVTRKPPTGDQNRSHTPITVKLPKV